MNATQKTSPDHRAQLNVIKAGLAGLMRKANGDARAITGRATAAGRDLTPDEAVKVDDLESKFRAYDSELATVTAELDEAEAIDQMHTPQPRLTKPAPVNGHGMSLPRSALAPVASPLFSNMFPTVSRAAPRDFTDLGDFAKAVMQRDPRLFNAAAGMGTSVGTDGGFYVPPGFFAGLMDDSLTAEAIRPYATIVPMTSGSVSIPMFNTSNRSAGIAGLEGKNTPEGATGTTQKAALREVGLTARKVSILVPTTTELLQDAPAVFSQMLHDAMLEAMGQTLDSWFISGNGAGVPLGILNAPCLVSVAKDSGQVAATLTPTNISGMVSRLAPGSWARSMWIVSPSALAQLFVLATVVKNVAGTENVGAVSHDFFKVLPDGKFSLLGRPLIVSDRCQSLGTKGDIVLVDLKSYIVGIRQEAELLVDQSIGFKESEVWFRLNVRVDGQPSLAAPITPRVGSATLSPFVSLDTRG